MIKKAIAVAAISLLTLPAFAVSNSDYKYNVDIDTKGNFKIVIKTKYPATKSLNSILKYSFMKEANLKAADNTMISSRQSTNVMTKIGATTGTFPYVQTNKSTKSGMTATITSNCSLMLSENKVSNTCKISRSSAPIIGSIFNYGSTSVVCEGEKGTKKSCVMTIKGQPDSINIPFKGRTEERLAVSGAVHTITATFKTYYGAINGYSKMKEASNDRFYSNNISGLWSGMIQYLRKQQYLSARLSAKSGENGYYVTTK